MKGSELFPNTNGAFAVDGGAPKGLLVADLLSNNDDDELLFPNVFSEEADPPANGVGLLPKTNGCDVLVVAGEEEAVAKLKDGATKLLEAVVVAVVLVVVTLLPPKAEVEFVAAANVN